MLTQMLEFVPEDPDHPVERGLYWVYRGGETVLVHLFSEPIYGSPTLEWKYRVVHFPGEDNRKPAGNTHSVKGSSVDTWGPRVDESWKPAVSEEEPTVVKTPEIRIFEFLDAVRPAMYAKDVEKGTLFYVQDVRMHNNFGQIIIDGRNDEGGPVSYMVEPEKLNKLFKPYIPTLGNDHP
jgi:hypothetical protein